jgi:nitroreductase
VCAYDAIDYESEEPVKDFEGIGNPESIIDYETISKFFLARRSIRRFKNEPVPEDTIKKILEAMRYAPSGSNKQLWQYIVVTDPAVRDKITRGAFEVFRKVKLLQKIRWLILPFLNKEERKFLGSRWLARIIDRTISDFAKGRDRIFFGAPCVLILHSPGYGNLAANDAGIALTLGMFAAQALGLGTCWIGFAEEAFLRNRKLRAEFGIPKGHAVRGVLALGYPNVRFSRAPVRKPLNVKWM